MTLPNISSLNLMSFAGLAAIGSTIALTWRYVATFFRYLFGLVIGTAILKDHAGSAAMAYSLANPIKSPFGMRVFGGYESYVHPKRWNESVAYEGISSEPFIFKYNRNFAIVSLGGNDGKYSNTSSIGDYSEPSQIVKILYFRWFFNIENFILDSIEFYNNQNRQITPETSKKSNNRFKIIRHSGSDSSAETGDYAKSSPGPPQPAKSSHVEFKIETYIRNGVYRLLKWKRGDLQLQPEDGQSPFSGYPFPKEIGINIQELELWLKNEKWFRSKSIPWRRGWLLYGPPGSGKTTLVRALGMSFDLPIYIFDLSTMTNSTFVQRWDDMMCNTPCIALIEDIDAVFNGREYIGSVRKDIPHITFDCILNTISGVKPADGVFIIITTNHIEKLDSALGIPDENGKSSRPGRIDKAIYLGVMHEEQRISLAKHILSDYPELIDETVNLGKGETPAQFQQRCAQLALNRFWTDKKSLVSNICDINPLLEMKKSDNMGLNDSNCVPIPIKSKNNNL